MIDAAILDSLAVAIPSIAVYIMTIKGIASVIANNFNTEHWGKAGEVIDWIASNNKKAKLTGDEKIDSLLDIAARAVPAKTILGKLLRVLS